MRSSAIPVRFYYAPAPLRPFAYPRNPYQGFCDRFPGPPVAEPGCALPRIFMHVHNM